MALDPMAQRAQRRDGGVCVDVPDQIAGLSRDLVGFAYSLTHDREEATDLAQEASARALARTWQFMPGTNLKAWLFRIALNLHLRHQRRSRRMEFISLEARAEAGLDAHTPVGGVEREALTRIELEAVGAALRTLPSRLAQPLLLSAIEQLSYAEIASRLELPIGTVMSRIYRARRLLASRLVEMGR